MSRTWHFTDVEFVALWDELREHRLPAPFVYTSRTRLYDDSQREKHAARQRMRAILDPSFDDVLYAVARPDLRVVVQSCDPADQRNPETCIRLHAARRENRAYVLTQLSGETVWHSAGFTVTECDVLDLAADVVSRLPEAAAGRDGVINFPARMFDHEADYEYGQSQVREPEYDHAVGRAESFLRAPMARIGRIQIEQADSRFGPSGITRRALEWRDLTDDGRYVLIPGTPPRAVGADRERLIAEINSGIAAIVRAIKDERSGEFARNGREPA